MRSLATLHDDHALRGRIDDDAPVTSASTVLIDAPAARVWEVLADLRGWERWAPAFRLRAGHEARLAALKGHIEGSA